VSSCLQISSQRLLS